MYVMKVIRDLYLEYIKNTSNLTIKRQIIQLKNGNIFEYMLFQRRYTGWGKSRFTLIHMANNAIINK